jgi:16S rRNA (guanine527-N7)-methyltransferase
LRRLAAGTTAGNRVLPELDAAQIQQLRKYLEVLLLWRRRMALISTADPIRLVEHHILDSLHVAPRIPPHARIADIGSGAGLPGIPLAVALPQAHVVLVESRRKKANFLREARRLANLGNVEIVESRAETLAPCSFDVIVSRALGRLQDFLALGDRLLVRGGIALAMRGPEGAEEAIADRRYRPPAVVGYDLAAGRRRTLLLYRRVV